MGRRRLRNTCLDLIGNPSLIISQLEPSSSGVLGKPYPCMTDKLSALSCLVSSSTTDAVTKDRELLRFWEEANGDALILNKWFSIQVRIYFIIS